MELSASELETIRRALTIYQIQVLKVLRNKGFLNDLFLEDIVNIGFLLSQID